MLSGIRVEPPAFVTHGVIVTGVTLCVRARTAKLARMYRAMVIEGGFGLDRLAIVERNEADPKAFEVTLSMRAVSLNYRDVLMIRGQYNPRQPLPLVPLSDGVGEVVAVGERVTGLAKGDRVCPLFCQRYFAGEPTKEKIASTLGGPLDGVLREQMTLSAESVVKVPAGLDDAQAATLPCAALTAWNALVEQGGLVPGQTVLVQGTGGVSTFALQIAKAMGARVIVTSSSEAKLERARALGADHGIDYKKTPQWGKEALKLTDDRGVDLVVEVGGAGTLGESLKAVRPGGTIAVIGMLAGGASEVNVIPILMRNIRVQGVFVGHKEAMVRMLRAFDSWSLKPVVDRVFPWTEARAALDHMVAGAHLGKVALGF